MTTDTIRYVTFPVESTDMERYLRHQFYKATKSAPNAQALHEAVGSLAARAQFDGPTREVYVRTAMFDGKMYLDLANAMGEVVEIDAHGWRIVSDPPVRFRRPRGLKALPRPECGGDLEELRRLINIESDDDWRLICAWLIQAIWSTGPYPILLLQGEQGSAKSTTAKILKSLVDPSDTAVRSTPRSEQDLIIAANNSHISSFDNLSGLAPQMSDAFCRLSTGGGFATRELYTNAEEVIFDVMRPVILNGISGISTRADLLDRAIVIELPRIDPSKRRTESELRAAVEAEHARILGAVCDAISGALRDLPSTRVTDPPRMADFANLATAAERALGWEDGAFMASFNRSRRELNGYALEADPVASGVLKLMTDREEWTGTVSELLEEINGLVKEDTRHYKTWPKQPQHLSNWLKRSAPVLRAEGIGYEDLPRTGTTRKKRLYRISSPEDPRPGRSPSPEAGANAEPVPSPSHSATPAGTKDFGEDDTRDAGDAGDGDLRNRKESHRVETPGELRDLVQEVGGVDTLAVDLETTGLDPRRDRARLISVSTKDGTWVVDCFAVDPAPLLDALSGKSLVFHHAAFDLGFLRAMGFESGEDGAVFDTMLMSKVVGVASNTNGKESA